jgi:hypothetical protein
MQFQQRCVLLKKNQQWLLMAYLTIYGSVTCADFAAGILCGYDNDEQM